MYFSVKRNILLFLFVCIALPLSGQLISIKGAVSGKNTGNALTGAGIVIKDAMEGTITQRDGSFKLETRVSLPFTIVVSMMGYQNQEFKITNPAIYLSITLEEQIFLGQEVVVSASRIPESIMRSPVTIEKLSNIQIQQNSAANFYDGLHQLKGVDMNVHSLTFRYPNTRGFTGEANFRMNQIVDGIENIPPGLSFSAGNIFGVSQLDVNSVELLVGASSALYGPGGMNGTLLMTSKDPFEFQGLSFSMQGGAMNLNAPHPYGANPMGELNFRYAKAFNNKLAFKITAGYLQATDWHAYDLRDKYNLDDPGSSRWTNPGYDGVNVYGDDIIVPVNLKDVAPQVAAGVAEAQGYIPGTPEYDAEVRRIVNLFPDQVVSRTGWEEKDLVDYGTRNVRIGGSLHYRFRNQFEAFIQAGFARGTSVYTAQNRFSLKDFGITNIRAEIKSPVFFLRIYTTVDNSGASYDAGGAALKLNESWKPSQQWYQDYISGFTPLLLMGEPLSTAYEFARTVADNRDRNGTVFDPAKPAFPLPGTGEFNSLYDRIITTPVNQGGAMVIDKSRLYHLEGMYNLSSLFRVVEFIAGASARLYLIDSDGTVFIDKPGSPVSINQFGAYVQVAKEMIKQRLKLTVSARYDKNQYFKGRVTPRASAVYSLGTDLSHHVRASVQTAFRFPSIADQMVDLDVGPYKIIGGLPIVHQKYNIPDNPVYPLSGQNPIIDSAVIENGPYQVPPFRPETVTAYELGYKGLILNKQLLVDAYIFKNRYNGFLGTQTLAQNPYTGNEVRYQTTVSTEFPVVAHGWALGGEFRTWNALLIKGNVSFNRLGDIKDPPTGFRPQFNTPRYKFNVGVGNRYLTHVIGFNINYRWQEAFLWESTFGTAMIPAYSILDAHVTLHFPKLLSRIKIGGSNLLNNYHTTSFGSAQIGAMYYVTWTFDELLN